ncbi:MarR family winged helix-turn-helix transcriptional regulator [Umezawaea sp.]|uniref:MarR family winged helix-turn-helix transcriptional regulator n=1 Tax=Umezawaea sp. TaxID=1955258 RepID=UPI002ED62F3C
MTGNEDGAPPPASVAFLAMALGRRIREHVEGRLREHGIGLRHLSALGHLHRQPGISYSELARRAGVTPQSMQDTLRLLEKLGAVERSTVPGRGRTAVLRVTDEGHRLRLEGQSAITAADAVIGETSAEFAAALGAALARFSEAEDEG